MVNRLNLPAGEGGVSHEAPFRSTYFCKKGRKRARQHRRGPINTGLRYIAGWRQRAYPHQRDQRCAWEGPIHKQPRKPKVPGLRGQKRFHTAWGEQISFIHQPDDSMETASASM